MSDFNKKYIKFAIVLTVICAIFIGSMYAYATFFRKVEVNTKKEENKFKYYVCYRTKEKQETCNGVPCLYSSYYKFFLIKDEKSNHNITGTRYKSYKFTKDTVKSFDINSFIENDQKYEYNENNYTYYIGQDVIIEYSHGEEFSIEKQLEYLKESGFSDCEISEE